MDLCKAMNDEAKWAREKEARLDNIREGLVEAKKALEGVLKHHSPDVGNLEDALEQVESELDTVRTKWLQCRSISATWVKAADMACSAARQAEGPTGPVGDSADFLPSISRQTPD